MLEFAPLRDPRGRASRLEELAVNQWPSSPPDDATLVIDPAGVPLGDIGARLRRVSPASRAALLGGLALATFVSSAAVTHCVRTAGRIPLLPEQPLRPVHHVVLHLPDASRTPVSVQTAATHLFAGELGEATEAYSQLAETEPDGVVFRVVARSLRLSSAVRKGGSPP